MVYEIDSTQDAILELPVPEITPGLVLAADVQTAGRGRGARNWVAESGDAVLMSLVIPRPEVPAPVLAAVAAMYVLQPTNPNFSLKWPNDIVVDTGVEYEKIGGIIATAVGELVVLGVGINLRMDPDSRPVSNARGLEDYGVRFNRDTLLLLYLDAVERLMKFPAETVLAMYRAACSTLGKNVRALEVSGNAIVGRASKIADDGSLILEISEGEISLNAVDVEYLR
ncbi:MAG: hypothetical protein RL038_1270 [Actinomycetota bacterium]